MRARASLTSPRAAPSRPLTPACRNSIFVLVEPTRAFFLMRSKQEGETEAHVSLRRFVPPGRGMR